MIGLPTTIIFYLLMFLLGLYSLLMIYALLRFGHSKILGLILSAFYVLLIFSLYAGALSHLHELTT